MLDKSDGKSLHYPEASKGGVLRLPGKGRNAVAVVAKTEATEGRAEVPFQNGRSEDTNASRPSEQRNGRVKERSAG